MWSERGIRFRNPISKALISHVRNFNISKQRRKSLPSTSLLLHIMRNKNFCKKKIQDLYWYYKSKIFSKYHVDKLLAADIVNHDIKNLTDDAKENIFIINDSFFNCTSELVSKIFDHTDIHFKKRFRCFS